MCFLNNLQFLPHGFCGTRKNLRSPQDLFSNQEWLGLREDLSFVYTHYVVAMLQWEIEFTVSIVQAWSCFSGCIEWLLCSLCKLYSSLTSVTACLLHAILLLHNLIACLQQGNGTLILNKKAQQAKEDVRSQKLSTINLIDSSLVDNLFSVKENRLSNLYPRVMHKASLSLFIGLLYINSRYL